MEKEQGNRVEDFVRRGRGAASRLTSPEQAESDGLALGWQFAAEVLAWELGTGQRHEESSNYLGGSSIADVFTGIMNDSQGLEHVFYAALVGKLRAELGTRVSE